MADPQSPNDSVEEYSAKTAEILRSMREHADKTLESHRQRIGNIETELSRRIHQIAEELARDSTDEELAAAAASIQREELEKTQVSFHEAEAEIADLHGQITALESVHDAEAVAQAEELRQLAEDRDQVSQERQSVSDELGQLLTEQSKSSEELVELTDEIESLRRNLDHISRERDQLAEQLEQLLTNAEQNDGEYEQAIAEIEELGTQHKSLQQERVELIARISQLETEGEQESQLHGELTSELEQLHGHHAQISSERDQLSETLEQLQAQHEELAGERDSLAGEKGALVDELQAAQESHSQSKEKSDSLEAQLQALQHEHDQMRQAFDEAGAANDELIGKVSQDEQLVAELTEQLGQQKELLEQSECKCELALADVQKLKRTNAELREELVSRPETDAHDSPELVSLRAERDALAGRVEELESASLPELDDDGQQELSDLQRRFEMAVEDVRTLKQENASLHEQLEATPTVEAASGGDMGWQAQKARLLASLNEEDEALATPERREERTTIQGTISITDQMVSKKDHEIAALKEQLETRPVEAKTEVEIEANQEELRRAAREELFSKDEIIQHERDRLEQLQVEWKEKLRTAELEISVQRASLAREKAKVEEKIAFLEKETAELEKHGTKPKKRWLTALGLNDDDEN
jgi:chromosome segregation ATPase